MEERFYERYVAVTLASGKHGGGRFGESTTIEQILEELEVQLNPEQQVFHGSKNLELGMTLRELGFYRVTLEVK